MTNTALFSAPFHFLGDALKAEFEAAVPAAWSFREVWGREELVADPTLAVWVCNPGARFIVDGPVLDLFPALKSVVTPSTGKNHIDVAECERRGIDVKGLLDIRPVLDSIRASAEFTFLHVLMALRRPQLGLSEVAAGRWRQNEDAMRGRELCDRTVGIVGLGRIGGNVARWATAFDATVSYYDPYKDDPRWPKLTSLEELFSNNEVVCITCVLTDETRGMINGPLLERLQTGAVLVNTARGEIIDQPALEGFLARRTDVTAGLDVLCGEVTATQFDSPLIDLHRQGRIAITPHIAGATLDSQIKAARGALELLKAQRLAAG